jgi:hypothetical protein
MTTTPAQLATFLAEAERVVASYRGTAAFTREGLSDVFNQIGRILAAGRRDLAAMQAPAELSAGRRNALLGTTQLGRVILRDDQPRPVPGPATALREATKPAAERTLTPARRRALLEATPAGRRILADEARARRR